MFFIMYIKKCFEILEVKIVKSILVMFYKCVFIVTIFLHLLCIRADIYIYIYIVSDNNCKYSHRYNTIENVWYIDG